MLGKIVDQKRARLRNGQIKSPRKSQVLEDANQNHKITEYFPVRRSGRKTGQQLEKEKHDAVEYAVYSGCNEKFLEVFVSKEKGRGIRTLKEFRKNEFVVEYKGEMIDVHVARIRERKYAEDPSIGSFMYYFKHNNKHFCVDATEETPYKGRLINHSVLRPNLKTKVLELKGSHHLVLVAKRDIAVGEELLYDYGDRCSLTVANNPWLLNS
uniref:[histone H4]-lysine(20) N-methyltransferase n=1 Tax=Ascaris suum TaxID=6253 RepID=F1LDN2_ASCSU